MSTDSKLYAEYLPKPDGYKTVNQWRKEGMRPKSSEVFEEFAAVNAEGKIVRDSEGKPYVYSYISPKNVEPIEKEPTLPISDIPKEKIVCFDTETTGFTKWDEIVQITISDGNGKELLNTFVKPVNKKSWNKASEINGIYPKDVADAPTAYEIRSKVYQIFENASLIIGHNVAFDIRMVSQCFRISLKDKNIFDTLDYFRKDVPKGSHKLVDAVGHYCPNYLKKFTKNAHKSDADVKATVKVFGQMAEKEKQRENSKTGASVANEIEFE